MYAGDFLFNHSLLNIRILFAPFFHSHVDSMQGW